MLGTLAASRTNDSSLSWHNFHFNCLGYNIADLAFTAENNRNGEARGLFFGCKGRQGMLLLGYITMMINESYLKVHLNKK